MGSRVKLVDACTRADDVRRGVYTCMSCRDAAYGMGAHEFTRVRRKRIRRPAEGRGLRARDDAGMRQQAARQASAVPVPSSRPARPVDGRGGSGAGAGWPETGRERAGGARLRGLASRTAALARADRGEANGLSGLLAQMCKHFLCGDASRREAMKLRSWTGDESSKQSSQVGATIGQENVWAAEPDCPWPGFKGRVNNGLGEKAARRPGRAAR